MIWRKSNIFERMTGKIIYCTEDDFVNYLEYAAVKRLVVELAFRTNPQQWRSLFIRKVWMDDQETGIEITKGQRYLLEELHAVQTPFDDYDLDALSCLCS